MASYHKAFVDCDGLVVFDFHNPDKNVRSRTCVNQFNEDPDIEVYLGQPHCSVKFFDIGVLVIFDPYKGDWKDADYARQEAKRHIRENMTVNMYLSLIGEMKQFWIQEGMRIGRENLRKETRKAFIDFMGLEI